MMGNSNNNKILTVSYGTFSCTLEGFDDSFETMKSIAEYFRDLAADDRYFGATPPTPDAEMLARIAEREIERRVAAREQEGRIVLTAAAAPVAAAPLATSTPAEETPQAEPEPEPAPAEAAPVADAAPQADAPEAAPAAAVAEEAAEPDAWPEPEETDEIIAEDDDIYEEEREDVTEAVTAAAEEFDAVTPDDVVSQEADVVEEVVAEAAAPATSIAERLQRIRAVVNKSQEAQEMRNEPTEYLEDQHADDFIANVAEKMVDDDEDNGFDLPDLTSQTEAVDAAEEIDAAFDEDGWDDEDADSVAEEDLAAETPDPENSSQSQEIANVLAELAAEINPEDTPEDRAVAEDEGIFDEVDDTSEFDDDDLDADEIKFAEDEAQADELDAMLARIEAEEAQADAVEDEAAAPEPRDNVFGDTLNAEEPAAAPEQAPKRRARVIKVRRADLQRAVEDGVIEDTTEDAPEAAADAAPAGADRIVASEQSEAPQEFKTDVNRLMDEAEAHMEEPESTLRRNAFQALKAAVAARKADRGMQSEAQSEAEAESDAYKSDLAKVVRPRRPEAPAEPTERPRADARPAPLRLVAEQRVDRESDAPAEPVQPRRVAETPREEEPAKEGFAAYVEEQGAHSLPELLEAAASYLAFVEGKEQFSRPQLMSKVRQIAGEDFSREEGLRSFGQLLRAGKIAKIQGGRFQATDETGYRPDQRAAG